MIAGPDDRGEDVRVPDDCGRGGERWWSPRAWREPLTVRATLPLRMAFGARHRSAFGILMYHRVTPVSKGLPRPTWNVTPDRFRAQLAGLLKRGYEPWPLRTVLDAVRSDTPIPRNVFVVTFDDGYENNVLHAWPILCELRVPATFFLATAYLGEPGPFPSDDWVLAGSDRVPAESWQPMSYSQAELIHEHGLVELAAHTHTHDDFRGRTDEFTADLRTCCDVLRSRFGIESPTFAFPYGTKHLGFSGPAMAAAARKAGVVCSLTTEDELVFPGDDPFDWGRFTAHDHDTAATLAAKLDGWFSFARDVWRSLKPARRDDESAAVTPAAPVAE